MDTNCLKDLDPALIRPGRIDRILSWKSMSALSIQQYLENYYMKPVPRRATLPDRTLTAAKLQSIVSNSPYPGDVSTRIEKLNQHSWYLRGYG